MTVVASRLYCAGSKSVDVPLDALAPCADKADLLWIGLNAPDEAELALVAARLSLHPLAVEDAVSGGQMPKVEDYGRHLFVVVATARFEEHQIVYGETDVFVGDRFIVTARHGSSRDHAPVRERLEANSGQLARGSDYVLHAIIDHIVDGYAPVIDAIEEEVLAIEDKALDAFLTKEQIAHLFRLRRGLMRFARRIEPMEDVAAKLAGQELSCIDGDIQPYFRDVQDHVRRVLHRADYLREILTSIIETSGLLEQQRQGVITRQLAAWAAILAVPTAIAGIYGMNFDFMPELNWRYGYFAIVGLMATVCVGLWLRFRRAGWL